GVSAAVDDHGQGRARGAQVTDHAIDEIHAEIVLRLGVVDIVAEGGVADAVLADDDAAAAFGDGRGERRLARAGEAGHYQDHLNMLFGIMAWTPFVPSTAWVILKSTATLQSA